MDTVIIILDAAILILVGVAVYKIFNQKENRTAEMTKRLSDLFQSTNSELRQEVTTNVTTSVQGLGGLINESIRSGQEVNTARFEDINRNMTARLQTLETRFGSFEKTSEQKLEEMRITMERRLTGIQEDNNRQLEQIQKTVDEKLETRLTRSFETVTKQLEAVYKGLGEMQSVAAGVSDLKKVLSNVKNRGILGEIQLGAILSDILAPEQYDTEVATVPNSKNHVEFAVKLPAGDGSETVYLPIDSKFPGDTYSALRDAYENGSREEIDAAKKQLCEVIRRCAKDIREKYVQPPYTTAYGIMFLPFEGLYAEVVNSGMVEQLQRDYSVNIAGPSTMAALLNSLQMGFRTLAIQKRSGEVWKVLGAVKAEFETFEKAIAETQKHIHKVDDDLEKLVGVRTRQINRRLKEVEALPNEDAEALTDNITE